MPVERILFCNCTYAQVVPKDVRENVLKHLCQSGRAFDAVADLCEMSARHDPQLRSLAGSGPLKIAACYPRAVKWLFAAAGAPLSPHSTQVLNMRAETSEQVIQGLQHPEVQPNLDTAGLKPVPPTADPAPGLSAPVTPEPEPEKAVHGT